MDTNSDRGAAARNWWISFLKKNGIDASVSSTRHSVDPYEFYNQWTAISTVEDGEGLQLLSAELNNFDTNAPKLFNIKGEKTALWGAVVMGESNAERTQKAKQKIAEVAVKKKEREQNSFKEQLMLLANIENLVKQNSRHQYEKFSFLRGQPADASLENEVYAFKGKQEFMRMTHLKLSALVP